MKTTMTYKLISASFLGALMISTAGCGKTEFQRQYLEATAQGAGTYEIPARVDVLLVTDDSGSMFGAYDAVRQQIPAFLTDLDNRGWDYHFATIPLTTTRTITQVAASRFDPNWTQFPDPAKPFNHPEYSLGLWRRPYPNALPTNVTGRVSTSAFRTIAPTTKTYNQFLAGPSNATNALELGFQNIYNALQNPTNLATNFLRPDAMLVVLIVGNGNDGTGVKYCTVAPGMSAPCYMYGIPDDTGVPSSVGRTYRESLANYIREFKLLKSPGSNPPSGAKVRFFSAVSTFDHVNNDCAPYGQGFNTKKGDRYIALTEELGNTQNVDLCQPNSIGTLVNKVSQNLSSTRMTMRTKYVVLTRAPNPNEDLIVTKTSAAGVFPLQESATDGWQYVGYVEPTMPVNSIEADTPDGVVEMAPVSGYLVRLNGSARLVGDERATILFKDGP